MLLYLGAACFFGLVIHGVVIVVLKREKVFSDGSKIYDLEILNFDTEKLVSRVYYYFSSSILIVFFSIISAFLGSVLGLYLFLNF